MVRINRDFLNEVHWPEYEEFSKYLETLVGEITEGIIAKIYGYKEEDIINGNLQ